MRTPYQKGTAFENRVKDLLEGAGYVVVRSARSGGLVDLVAMRRDRDLLVQCKKDGEFPPEEWNRFWSLAVDLGKIPVLARVAIPRGPVILERLGARKVGVRGVRAPVTPFVP